MPGREAAGGGIGVGHCTGHAAPISRIRRIAAMASSGNKLEAQDLSWLGAALERYLSEAQIGMTLERALDVAPRSGEEVWWRAEARAARNAAIAELRRSYFGDLRITDAAREICRLASRVQARSRGVRSSAPDAIDERVEALVTHALCTGAPFPGPKQIQNILEIYPQS